MNLNLEVKEQIQETHRSFEHFFAMGVECKWFFSMYFHPSMYKSFLAISSCNLTSCAVKSFTNQLQMSEFLALQVFNALAKP